MEETAQVNNPPEVNQPIQTPVENSVPTKIEVKPKKNSGLALILSFTTIIATLIAGFFYYQNTQLRVELTKRIESIPTPISTEIPNETADWKTYTDTNGDYSFKHPSNWNTLSMGENTLMVAPQEDIDKVSKMLNSGGGFEGGDFLIMLINSLTEKPLIVTDEYKTVKESKIVISSIDTSKYEITYLQSLPGIEEGKTHVSVVVPINEKYLNIDLLEQKYLDIYNLVLDSFKITN